MVLDMVPRCIWCAVFLLFCTNACSCFYIDDSTCDSPADTRSALTCESLFKIFENALLSNGLNLYKLKKLFYTNPPELANISYYLEFKNNNFVFNNSVADFGTSDELPLCSCAGASILNQTINYMINNATIRLRYGWTTIDVYNFIHPALLNQLQIQLPFIIMKIATNGSFPFLWDGHNQLPSTNLHLFIPTNSLSCIPCYSQLDGVMKTLTSLVSSMSTCSALFGNLRNFRNCVAHFVNCQIAFQFQNCVRDFCNELVWRCRPFRREERVWCHCNTLRGMQYGVGSRVLAC